MTRRRRIVPGMVFLALIKAAIFTVTAQAQSAAPTDFWKFSITPYFWAPNINATLKYSVPPGAGGSPAVEIGPNDWLEDLSVALSISGEVRKDRWLAFTDIIYLDFSSEDSAIKSVDFGGSLVSSSANVATSSSLRGLVWTLGAGYAALQDRPVTLDVFGGLRYAARRPRPISTWRWLSAGRVAGRLFREPAASPRGWISGMGSLESRGESG